MVETTGKRRFCIKYLQLLYLAPFLVSLHYAHANEVTVTLQNGLNGYTGCDDAFITDLEDSKNYGDEDKLAVEFQEVKSVSC